MILQNNIDWKKIRLVVFDIDGTLYSQNKMRILIFLKMCSYFLLNPHKIFEMKIILTFRSLREIMESGNLEKKQYLVVAQKLGLSEEKVKNVILKWMYIAPLKYFLFCRYKSAIKAIEALTKAGKKIAFLSDYPLKEKLSALGIIYNSKNLFYTASPEIDAFKPDTKGLFVILKKFELLPEQVLLVGDREEKDGKMAKILGVPYLLVGKNPESFFQSLLNII